MLVDDDQQGGVRCDSVHRCFPAVRISEFGSLISSLIFPRSLGVRLEQLLQKWRHSTRPYLMGRQHRLTYADCWKIVTENQAALSVGSTNSALLATGVEYAVSYWSLLCAGATVVPLSPRASDPELQRHLTQSDCTWLVCDAEHRDVAQRLANSTGVGLVVIDHDLTMSAILSPTFVRNRKNRSGTALLLQTSGSTGRSSAVELTHESLVDNATAHGQSIPCHQSDRVLVVLPLNYSYTNTAQLLCHTGLGSSLTFYEERVFLPRRFCELIEQNQITITSVVPALLHILNEYRYLENHDLTQLRYLCFGGAPPSVRVLHELKMRLPETTLVHTYGLTEAGPRVTSLSDSSEFDRLPSIGKPLPGVEVRIVDSENRPAGVGEAGELLVRSRGLMSGYYGAQQTGDHPVQDGWLRTGDLATRDEQGYLHLSGRLKNVIVTGGLNVTAEEIESQLIAHPSIIDALVRSEPDEVLGEVPVAYVTLADDSQLSLEQVQFFLRDRVSQYKWPHRLYVHSTLERTDSGKVRRPVVESVS